MFYYFQQIQDQRFQLLSLCYYHQTCEFDINVNMTSPHEECSDFRGEMYMEISYRCEERKCACVYERFVGVQTITCTLPVFLAIVHAIEDNFRLMCSMPEPWSGSHLYLSNSGYPQFTNDRGCTCAVQVARHVQLEVTLLHFDAVHERDGECHQRFVIESNDVTHEVCSEAHDLDRRALNMTYVDEAFWAIENRADERFRFLLVLQGLRRARSYSIMLFTRGRSY